jgi:uncharacterized membrane protein
VLFTVGLVMTVVLALVVRAQLGDGGKLGATVLCAAMALIPMGLSVYLFRKRESVVCGG